MAGLGFLVPHGSLVLLNSRNQSSRIKGEGGRGLSKASEAAKASINVLYELIVKSHLVISVSDTYMNEGVKISGSKSRRNMFDTRNMCLRAASNVITLGSLPVLHIW